MKWISGSQVIIIRLAQELLTIIRVMFMNKNTSWIICFIQKEKIQKDQVKEEMSQTELKT